MTDSVVIQKIPLFRKSSHAGSKDDERKSAAFTDRWKRTNHQLTRELYTLYAAWKHPCVPWYAKACAAGAVGYAISPVNLIPDCIPVLGQLDDLVAILLGMALMRKLIPDKLLETCSQRARDVSRMGTLHKGVATALVARWMLSLVIGIALLRQWWPLPLF